MKKTLRIFALVLALVITVGALAGCGGEKNVSTGGTFTYWVRLAAESSQTLSSFNDMLMYQELNRITGTNVEFIHPSAGSTGTEAFQILLSSGDYPDMIEYAWNSYAGGPDQAINDGVIISLNDYMEDYAPNYYDYMEGKRGEANGYLYKAQTMTQNGNYYGFNDMNIGNYRCFSGLYIRKDKLDEWNLDIPTTIDEWETVLTTAKENGFEKPLTGVDTMFSVTGVEVFNGAWNVGKDWYVENDKVKFGPFEKGYKDYVAKMAEWKKKGLIDQDYITNAATDVEGSITNDISIASYGAIGSAMGKLLPAMEEKNPEFSVVACPYPVLKKGDTVRFQGLQSESKNTSIAISVQCGAENEDRYKEAIKWCDYLYSDEGIILKNFGVEDETFVIQKGEDGEDHYIYTDKIYDHEKIGAHSVQAALWHFFRPSNSPGLNQHNDYVTGFYPYEQQREALPIWNASLDEARKVTLPTMSYTGEESSQIANIEAKGRDNLDAAISNIILGKASIDTYDEAIAQAKKAGYDDLRKIHQAAYDRYISVINN